MPGTELLWDTLAGAEHRLGDLVFPDPTPYRLEVASTPRYYISASTRELDRGSKHVLFFGSAADRDLAYLLLNSSLPYWWWRCLDGGVTLPLRTLLSLPVPPSLTAASVAAAEPVLRRLEASETSDVVTKLNAGRRNENVRRPRALVEAIDAVYSPDMFAPSAAVPAPAGDIS